MRSSFGFLISLTVLTGGYSLHTISFASATSATAHSVKILNPPESFTPVLPPIEFEDTSDDYSKEPYIPTQFYRMQQWKLFNPARLSWQDPGQPGKDWVLFPTDEFGNLVVNPSHIQQVATFDSSFLASLQAMAQTQPNSILDGIRMREVWIKGPQEGFGSPLSQSADDIRQDFESKLMMEDDTENTSTLDPWVSSDSHFGNLVREPSEVELQALRKENYFEVRFNYHGKKEWIPVSSKIILTPTRAYMRQSCPAMPKYMFWDSINHPAVETPRVDPSKPDSPLVLWPALYEKAFMKFMDRHSIKAGTDEDYGFQWIGEGSSPLKYPGYYRVNANRRALREVYCLNALNRRFFYSMTLKQIRSNSGLLKFLWSHVKKHPMTLGTSDEYVGPLTAGHSYAIVDANMFTMKL